MKDLWKAEIINFGNELLIGRIVNSNASWLATKLTELGIFVNRITILSDDYEDLKKGFKEALNRKIDIIISTGGLGPTWDDRTAEGLAQALNIPLNQNKKAMEMINNRYRVLGVNTNPESKKMADLPIGSIPLSNSVGTAPGIKYRKDRSYIYCVPGVPSEMKAIFEDHIYPELKAIKSKETFFQEEFVIKGIGESRLAHITNELNKKFPHIYIKSHPNQEMTYKGLQSTITFHVTAYGNEKTEIDLKEVVKILKEKLINIGAKFSE
ncbi:MAG: molybdopterin-binding protein [Candidatus Hodarchaeales archaeon]|jgi:molybdenum cofactor synthesis domain-containing protein